MSKIQYTFPGGRLFLFLLLHIFFYGCSSDNPTPEEPNTERTEIVMEMPGGNGSRDDINWENASLVWRGDFDNSTSFKSNWAFEPNSNNPDAADQLQTFSEKNIEHDAGIVKLIAKKEGPGGGKGDYTSARITAKYAFQYGRLEIRAKLPSEEKKGLWAKIALIGNNEKEVGFPMSGEIDIMEYLSATPNQIFVTLHSGENNADNGTLLRSMEDLDTAEEAFHNYGILWTDQYIKFYIDDVDNVIYEFRRPAVANEENWPFDQPFYLLMDLVVGGRYAGAEGVDDSQFPTAMEIDYVHLYHAQ